ncbi:unnamed protein product [Auanema sp. JU1783]|nr:unnamed protein product [Auanema sp. JU1783]
MSSKLVVLLALAASAFACDVQWPNTTNTEITWWQCGGQIQFTSAKPTDMKGNYEYPIHLSKPLLIVTDANNPKNVYDKPNLKQTINVWSWTTSCTWSSVPTFGLLKNLDACTNGVQCPIKTGKQVLKFELDFSDYGTIINLLKDNAPYQLEYELHDTKLGQAACIMFQAKAFIT